MQRFQLVEIDVYIHRRKGCTKLHIVSEADDASITSLCSRSFPLDRVIAIEGSRNDYHVCVTCHEQWRKAKRK